MVKANLTFKIERETKGAVLYTQIKENGETFELRDGAEVGSFYMRKTAFKGGVIPEKVKVTIEG